RTRAQLPVLDAAGVVDAGGLGLLVMLDALAEAVTGVRADRPRFHRSSVTPHATTRAAPGHGHVDAVGAGDLVGFEVVYRVTRIGDDDVVALRRALAELGDSVVVAGDGVGTWTAHVHTANAGVAVEAGLGFGRIHDIRIEALVASEPCVASTPAGCRNPVSGRDILAVVAGAGAEKLYADEGATVLRCDTSRIGTSELCAAIVGSEHTEVLVLPNGALSAQELVSVSIASRTAGKDVLMLPSSAMVQGLAALAVHDATRAAVDDAFAMSEAAAGTRWASLRIAEERSLTWAGTCEPGDGLGLVGPEVVVIGPDVVAAGRDLLDQLLSVGGEMVTMLCGACEASLGDEKSVAERLTAYVATRHPGVEVVVYQGGQPGDVLQLGVE
ncbi:MAG: glycerol kinase, partial [Rhodococcus sp. (in: high G+C Gram-positive bacteria)]